MRRFLFGSKRRKVTTAVVAVVLLLSTAAIAAWLVTSSGSAGGKFGSMSAPTVTAEFAAGAGFIPTADYQELYADIGNGNVGPVYIAGVTLAGPPDTSSAVCDASLAGATLFSPAAGIYNGATPLIPGANEDVLLAAISLGTGVATECQGLDVSVPLTVQFSTSATE